MTFTAQILTLYPEMFPRRLDVSLTGKTIDMLGSPVIVKAEFVNEC